MYINAATDGANAALRARPEQLPAPAVIDTPSAAPAINVTPDLSAPTAVVVPPIVKADDPDAAPASAPPKPKTPPPPEVPADGNDAHPSADSQKPKEDVDTAPPTNGNTVKGDDKPAKVTNGTED
jgi:hypothetical protein